MTWDVPHCGCEVHNAIVYLFGGAVEISTGILAVVRCAVLCVHLLEKEKAAGAADYSDSVHLLDKAAEVYRVH